jgi:hypothetical protein
MVDDRQLHGTSAAERWLLVKDRHEHADLFAEHRVLNAIESGSSPTAKSGTPAGVILERGEAVRKVSP